MNYGARGWVCHHNFDLWLGTAPIDNARCGFWPVGGAWLSKHLWDHYEYQPNRNYLAKVYPVMKGAAEFFLDTLVEDPRDKCLVTCPSTSPERPNPTGTGLCAGSTMDMGILRDLFDNCIKASGILGVDADFRAKLQDARNRLAPLKIGKHGQIQEWRDDWDINEHDNHVSHLYNLFPSCQITPTATPQLADAARVSLRMRGDGDSSWGKAWRINLHARLSDGSHAQQILSSLLKERSAANLFSLNSGIFQIDGNLGAVSGIAEMLLQSHDGVIHLLPALPPSWPTGRVKGLRARGGIVLDFAWKDGKLMGSTLHSAVATTCKVRYAGRVIDCSIKSGEAKELTF
jgi:alpha-L-fucosidase 2